MSEQSTTPRPGAAGAPEPDRTPPSVDAAAAERNEPGTGRRRARLVALVLGITVAVLAALYALAYVLVGGEVPRGTTVAGVEIGGLSQEVAEAELTAGLADRLDDPLVLAVDTDTLELDPQTSGLSVDVPGTVDVVIGGASPAALWRGIVGGGEEDLVLTVDQAKLDESLQAAADRFDRPAADGSVAFADGAAQVTPATVGRALDRAAAATAVRQAFLATTDPVQLPMTEAQPAIDQADVDAAVSDFATPAMSGPVTVVAGEVRAVLTPSILSQAVTLTATPDGTLAPAVDGDALLAAGAEAFGDLSDGPKDASIVIEGGVPVVRPGEVGQGISPADLSTGVLAALTQTGDARTATVALATVEPELTTEEAGALGVSQVVASTTTRFPYAAYRNTNIGRAAAMIDNTFLAPGETFSLNGIVGERTEANGFTTGWTIQNGALKEDLGGGVSQVATTTFNAAYKAGMQDVEHKPHSLYFDRYPAGVEATVAWPSLDLKFTNDTPYGVVVDTEFGAAGAGGSGSLTVNIWSSPYWAVDVQTSGRYAPKAFGTVYDTSPDCQAQAGQSGFQMDVTRTRTSADQGTKTDGDHVVYNAGSRIVCGAAPGG